MPNSHGDTEDAEFLFALGQIGTHIQQNKLSYIYALWDPDTFRIHYLGRSANVKDRLQKHIGNARSDNYHYRSALSEWIRSLLARGVRPEAHILETIYPCWSLRARDLTYWFLYGSSHGQTRQAGFAYDIYVSEREMRHILHAAAQGHPLANMFVAETTREMLARVDATSINFLTVEHGHPIWGMIRNNMRMASAPSMGENIEYLMRNAQTRRAAKPDASS